MTESITLHIHLADIEPKIWRRVSVPADYTLAGLHFAIQAVMGWEDGHLHMFIIDGRQYGLPEDADGGRPILEEADTRLSQVLTEGQSFIYVYDFGDDWRHKIEVESINEEQTLLACLDGARACPPEDCGGPYAYPDLLEAIHQPKSANPDYLDWIGEFEPEQFDLSLANKRLRSIAQRSPSRH